MTNADDPGAELDRLRAEVARLRRAEEELRAAEECRRRLLAAMPDVVWSVSADGRQVFYLNPAAEAVYGRPAADFYADPALWRKAVHPEDRARLELTLRNLRDEEQAEVEYRIFRPSGEVRWLSARVRVVRDPEGRPLRFEGISTDVTERRSAENTLRVVLEGTRSATGADFFRLLVQHLATALNVRVAAVGALSETDPHRARTVALWMDGRFVENAEYDLRGTPCEQVLTGGVCFYPARVRELFPDDSFLQQMGAESYLGAPVFDAGGALRGLLAVVDDRPMRPGGFDAPTAIRIFAGRAGAELQRLRAEEALRAGEQRLREMVERLPVGAVFVEGERIAYNPAVEAITGYARDELRTADDWFRRLYGDDAAEVRAAYAAHLREGDYRPLSGPIRRRDGRIRVVDVTPYAAGGGDVWLVHDITERLRADEATRAANERLRAVIEASPLATIVFDAEGRVRLWNPAAERLFGWKAEEVIGGPPPYLPEDRREEFAAFAEQLRRGVPYVGVETVRRKRDGALVAVSVSAAPIRDARGALDGAVKVIADVSERRQAENALRESEEQLRQAAKMEAVGRLAGGVAHDFNNLLTVILGYAEVLASGLEPEHRFRAHAEAILSTGRQAADLTKQLLAFGRKSVVAPVLLDLNRLIGGMEDVLRRLLGEGVRLVVEPVGRPVPVRADPAQMEQVLLNLCVNAREAMPEGGTVTICAGVVARGSWLVARGEDAAAAGSRRTEEDLPTSHEPRATSHALPPAFALLSVSDTGVGIPPELVPHLFEPFFTTKEIGRSTGLGLASVYGIVRQSDGHIEVDSAPGRGSTFRIYLPLARADWESPVEKEEEPAAAPEASPGRATVLLAEDEDSIRALAAAALRSRGYAVLQAASAEEALEVRDRHGGVIDLLLTDVAMPGMNGRQLADRMAERQPGLRVLYVSGYPDDALTAHGGIGPNARFLPKPFTPGALLRAVRELLEG